MKGTVLIDNKAKGDGLIPEWGLSIFIEYRGKNYLLDTGASPKFAANARELGIDLSRVDIAVLSHAHYDHGNGIREFFAVNQKAKLYIGASAGCSCYSKFGFVKKYIGVMPEYIDENRDRIISCAIGEGEAGEKLATIDEGCIWCPTQPRDLRKSAREITCI